MKQQQQQQQRIQLTPLYYAGTTTTSKDQIGTSVILCLPVGRKELALIWWKGCPNQPRPCRAHIPNQKRTRECCQYCRPLREHVNQLSKEILTVNQNKLVVARRCRHRDWIQLNQLYRLSLEQDIYNVKIGKDCNHPWMRFRVDWVDDENETFRSCRGSSNSVVASCPKETPPMDQWLSSVNASRPKKKRKYLFARDDSSMDSFGSNNRSKRSLSCSSVASNTSIQTTTYSRKRKLFPDWNRALKETKQKSDKTQLPNNLLAAKISTDMSCDRYEVSVNNRFVVESEHKTTGFSQRSRKVDDGSLKLLASKGCCMISSPSKYATATHKITPYSVTKNNFGSTVEEINPSICHGRNLFHRSQNAAIESSNIPSSMAAAATSATTTTPSTTKLPVNRPDSCVCNDIGEKEEVEYSSSSSSSCCCEELKSSSYLSIPLQQQSESYSSLSSQGLLLLLSSQQKQNEGIQIPLSNSTLRMQQLLPARAVDLTLTDWKILQSHEQNTNTFRRSIIDWIITHNINHSGPKKIQLPSLMNDETIVNPPL